MSKDITLVTGGLGFIGQSIVRRLTARGRDVRIIDNLSNPTTTLDEVRRLGVDFVEGDICEASTFAGAMNDVRRVIHLAAQTSVAPSIQDPTRDLAINGHGTLNLLESSRNAGVTQFILASSNATCGLQPPPFHENLIPKPVSPYGCSKLLAESYCHCFSQLYGMRSVALRFSNVYGPNSWRKGSVVATFIKRALSGLPLVLNGGGGQTRDFLFIEDLVDAVERAEAVSSPFEIFCIGSGSATSIRDLAERIGVLYREWHGSDLRIESGTPLPGDVADNWSDVTKARRILDYSAETTLDTGLAATFDWFARVWSVEH